MVSFIEVVSVVACAVSSLILKLVITMSKSGTAAKNNGFGDPGERSRAGEREVGQPVESILVYRWVCSDVTWRTAWTGIAAD